jgi:hypothetical protein
MLCTGNSSERITNTKDATTTFYSGVKHTQDKHALSNSLMRFNAVFGVDGDPRSLFHARIMSKVELTPEAKMLLSIYLVRGT